MSLQHYFRNIFEGKRNGLDAFALTSLLGILSVPYGSVMRLRALAYRTGWLPTRRLPKPVISVGNLTAGGTGKTPLVAIIARYYIDRGKKVVVLSRGYGGTSEKNPAIVADGKNILMMPEEAGDGPFMLAKKIRGLMVVVGADRYRSGIFAMERLAPDLFILDDGFQHLRLHRDLNILLMDHTRPLGNGSVLPAGLLREPRTATGRADLLIFTRCVKDADKIHLHGVPVCHAFHELAGFVPLQESEKDNVPDISVLKGVAFAGIADPDSFFSMLRGAGLDIKAEIRFPDHCGYGAGEIDEILKKCESVDGEYLITTEKDSVKLKPGLQKLGRIYAAGLDVRIPDVEFLTEMLEKFL